jgi:hypothetical protein
MKKLSLEEGHLVLRNLDGTLCWSRHWIDMIGSYRDIQNDGGGYIEIFIEGTLHQKSKYPEEERKYEL